MSRITLTFGGKKFKATETTKQLTKFGNQWLGNARRSLTASDAKATGDLYNSLPDEPRIFQDGKTFGIDITPTVPYWEYVDKGVQGAKRNIFPRQNESPFRYTTKMPPAGPIDRWMNVKGVSPRDSAGRFTSRKSMQYLIRRSIYTRGLKPRLFITGTKERIEKKAVQGIGRGVSKDIANAMRQMIKDNGNNS